MDINRFEPCSSVAPHHIVMLAIDYQRPDTLALPAVVYSGPLKEVPAEAMDTAKLCLVHPGTLAAIKARLDIMGEGVPAEEG